LEEKDQISKVFDFVARGWPGAACMRDLPGLLFRLEPERSEGGADRVLGFGDKGKKKKGDGRKPDLNARN